MRYLPLPRTAIPVVALATLVLVILVGWGTVRSEDRVYCFGEIEGGILTVRVTYRASVIRLLGVDYWRKGKAVYEHENKISR